MGTDKSETAAVAISVSGILANKAIGSENEHEAMSQGIPHNAKRSDFNKLRYFSTASIKQSSRRFKTLFAVQSISKFQGDLGDGK